MFRVMVDQAEWGWLTRLARGPVEAGLLTSPEANIINGMRVQKLVAEAGGLLFLTVLGLGLVTAAPRPSAGGVRIWAEAGWPS